ncbi:putative aminoacrylate hydrolase-like protein [Diplogelasinospora grovesii]|uniref:Aminoacrylate hydrolase-like protein n=1 Tax=Diplogelasinospora grovesii TaxID=303347 RepID=A0AAN6N1G5_9PEZI|nr:putative aminoacrylate hydrolase-like protein [Diplogelasinospora grovesii]
MATYETAENQYTAVGGVRYAYRRLGPTSGVPLVMLMHYRGTMDHWDPALINPLAASRPVILLDNSGVGSSGGDVPKSFAGWAQNVIDVASALGVRQMDVFGFSMGGCCAQMVALNAPLGLVRRLILAGTTPSSGPGVKRFHSTAEMAPFVKLSTAQTEAEQRAAFLATFFPVASRRSQAAGEESWRRIMAARPSSTRTPQLDGKSAKRQGAAFANFMDPGQARDGSFERLKELQIPVLIANGAEDMLLPTENSFLMYKLLPNAHLHLYPDSGHGFLYQYADHFTALINMFLDEPAVSSRL